MEKEASPRRARKNMLKNHQMLKCCEPWIAGSASVLLAAWFTYRSLEARYVHPALRGWQLYYPLPSSNHLACMINRHVFSRVSSLPQGVWVKNISALPQHIPLSWHLRKWMGEYSCAQAPVPLRIYAPSSRGTSPMCVESFKPRGVILWFHGGGFIGGDYQNCDHYCGKLALDTGAIVVSVQYRLAPEDPFPAAFFDAAIGLHYAADLAKDLGLKLAISGQSAGGGLAASVAQYAADAGVPIALQALVYPMLDSATRHSRSAHTGVFVWPPSANRYAWNSYLRRIDDVRDPQLRSYAVPAKRANYSGLPPAWIGCGDLDLFVQENRSYARRLQEAGVACEYYEVPAMYHGADSYAPDSALIRDFRASMIAAICRVLNE